MLLLGLIVVHHLYNTGIIPIKVTTVSLANWKVDLSYNYNNGDYLETPTITYSGRDKLRSLSVLLYRDDGSGLEMNIDPAKLSSPYVMPSSHSHPEELDYIEILWNDNSVKHDF